MAVWQVTITVTIALFLAGHLGAAIWFASGMKVRVDQMTDDLRQLTAEVRALVANEVRMGVMEQRITELEKRFDAGRWS